MSVFLCSFQYASTHHGAQQGEAAAGHLTCVRHGTYLRGGTGYSSTEPVLESAELITSRLTGAGSLPASRLRRVSE
ncbi:hypothetical protein TNCV_3610331 [Trichonephila clavipes]|nr:hypothetical protein TNCV_3610331 [Trichonephila clavipes]